MSFRGARSASPESITTTGRMDSGQPLHGFRNDGLSHVDRSQKFLRFLERRKTAKLAVVGIVFGCVRRPERDKFVAVLLNNFCQVLTVEGRHMPRPAVRAIIVAHAGPLVGPYTPVKLLALLAWP
jgi:hypothetical protein